MVPMPAEGEADSSASTKVAGLVEIGIQAFADRDVPKLETCLKDIFSVVRELDRKQSHVLEDDEDLLDAMIKAMKGEDGGQEEYDTLLSQNKTQVEVYREYERMTQLPGTRLPELIRLCIDQEDNPRIFLFTAEIILKLNCCRSPDENHEESSLPLVPPEKLFRIMSNSQDLAVLKRAFVLARDTVSRTKDLDSNPLLGPAFVDILLRLGIQYPEQNEFNSRVYGISGFFENNLCTTKYLGETRATAVIRKVLNVVADIIANDASSPSLMVFALKLFTSVSVTSKRGELRIMINGWIQEGLHRLIDLLHDPDDGVQEAAMEVFHDVIRSSPEICKQVADGGVFAKVAAALNRVQFDDLGNYALRLLCKCIRKKPEDCVIQGIFEAQIPAILTQRFLKNDDTILGGMHREIEGLAVQCLIKLCEFIPLTLAKNLLQSGEVLEWLNFIKEDPYKLSRFNLLKAILKHLAPTLKNDYLPSFQALTQMMSETVGLDVAQRIEAVGSPEDLDIHLDDDDVVLTFLVFTESDAKGTEKGSDSEGTNEGMEGSDAEGTDEGMEMEGSDSD